MKKHLIFLFIIIVLAFVLRIYNLTVTPPSPDWDEVSLGYNAFSILHTARDEYGRLLPLTLRSFNDYKPALYTYLTIPSIAVFGLNLFAVRLPSVVLGVLTVLGVYFLSREILQRFANKYLISIVPLLASFFLAISPWHLQFSRAAFEANISLLFIVWGMAFFICGLKKSRYLPLSSFTLGVSLYAYHSARVFVPALIISLAFVFKNELLKFKKSFLISIIIGFIVSLPVILILVSPEGRQRFSGVSVYSNQTKLLGESVRKLEQDRNSKDPLANLWHNRRIAYIDKFIEGYLTHFNPKWLFLTGDGIKRHHAPGMGMLYLFELPLVLIGLYIILRVKDKIKYLLLLWFLIAALPGSPTEQVPNAPRSYYFLPTYQIFSALGLYFLWSRYKNAFRGKIFLTIFLFFVFFNVFYYFQSYHLHLSKEYSQDWQYGYEEAVTEAAKRESQYEKIVFSQALEQPYIFYLFYTKYDPQKYLSQGGSNNIDYQNWSRHQVGKYEFKKLNWLTEEKNKTLFIGRPDDFPVGVKAIKKIKNLDGTDAVLFVEG